MSDLVFYTIEPFPLPSARVTLDMMPEGVECVCKSDGYYRMVLCRHLSKAHRATYDGNRESSPHSPAGQWEVLSRLDGQPLPVPALPKTLADAEEGRLYELRAQGWPNRYAKLDGKLIISHAAGVECDHTRNDLPTHEIFRALPLRVVRHTISENGGETWRAFGIAAENGGGT